jgi:hypothetical protein
VPLQENDYPPPAIQNRADICAINAIVIGKSDLASLTVNCGSQQVNDVVFVKDKCVAVFGGKQNATPADIVGSPGAVVTRLRCQQAVPTRVWNDDFPA